MSPETSVALFPLLGLAAEQARKSGAWRVWEAARYLDEDGSGVVLQSRLFGFVVLENRVNLSTWKRWESQAVKLGYLQPIKRHTGVEIYKLIGITKLAQSLNLEYIGKYKCELPFSKLLRPGWRSALWAGYITTTQERPISRAKMREITGVPESTQQFYEREAGIVATVNYAHDEGRGIDHLPMVQEYERPHAFKYQLPGSQKQVIAWRLPDNRRAPAPYRKGARGRSKQINRTLRGNSSSLGTVSPSKAQDDRLFHEKETSVKHTLKKIARKDISPVSANAVRELYQRKQDGYQCHQYRVISTL